MCDAFGIPLLVVVDVPGYLPGTGQEWNGVVRRGAKLLHAFAAAAVPRITLVTRKAYGGAYIAMNSRALGATHVMAWPNAQVDVMGAVAAVRVLHRRQLAEVPDEQKPILEARLAEDHLKASGGLARAIEGGMVDEIIEPDTTRTRLAALLAEHPTGRGTHGNIPL
jgi:acetyl-CoA/propionyl-CoA carboxylase carboxyl transferase subunit